MKAKKKMPRKGQFVAIWIFGGKPWSSTMKWKKGVLKMYCPVRDRYVDNDYDDLLWQEDTRFIKL